jgi:hypothetical protein
MATSVSASDWNVKLGGEYRVRAESIDPPAFGLSPFDSQDTLGQRALMNVAVTAPNRARTYIELGAYDDQGRQPRPRPIDQSALDLAQAYIEMPIGNFQAKIGRQTVAFTRLIATRDASNARRAFDMARVDWNRGAWHGLAMAGRPVRARYGAFDDDHEPDESIWVTSLSHSDANQGSIDVFYIDHERLRPYQTNPRARESRHNVGSRWSARGTLCSLELQASMQFGHLANDSVRAFGFATDSSCALPVATRWRWGVRLDYASGDSRANDGRNETFDPLYPNLSYFTDAPVLYPGNNFDVHPYLMFASSTKLSVSSGAEIMFRARAADSNYQPPGIPLAGPQSGSSGGHLATLAYIKGVWHPRADVDVTASYVYGFAGAVIDRAHGRDFRYALLQLSWRR